MALEVFNFYTKDKLSTNRYHNTLMSSALFYLLVTIDGFFKEFAVQIPKKYRYERSCFYGDCVTGKVNEYNVLVDFLKNNKKLVTEKWELSEEEYLELLDGLKLTLLRDYSTCSNFRKWVLTAAILIKGFVRKLLRRNR